jgi:ribonuclease P protein component
MESEYAEENVSTEQPPACKKARLSREDGDKERPGRDQASPSERTQEINSSSLLGLGLPKESRIAKRSDFLRVYEQGKRFEGRFMTVFILPSKRPLHRVGVTATKKAIGKAHDRNRAKRLLRESFRLSRPEIEAIGTRYDWVINARRSLLHVKLEKPLAELRQMARQVRDRHLDQLPQGPQRETGE